MSIGGIKTWNLDHVQKAIDIQMRKKKEKVDVNKQQVGVVLVWAAALGNISPALLGKTRPRRLHDCAHNSSDLVA